MFYSNDADMGELSAKVSLASQAIYLNMKIFKAFSDMLES